MIISQEIHCLIGTKENIEALAKKDHARVLVISDSHRNAAMFATIVRHYGAQVDALIFCGDGIGDLAQLLSESKENQSAEKFLPKVIAFARGNGDPSSYPVTSALSIHIPDMQILTVNGHKFMIVHGHKEDVDFGTEGLEMEMQLGDCDVAFYGHTHVAKEERNNGLMFVNPGSISRPRGGQPPCFAIATVEKSFVDIAFIKINSYSESDKTFQLWNPIY